MIPTFSEGPPETTSFTTTVSFMSENDTPMPEMLPSSSLLTLLNSLAGMYVECGSRFARIFGIDCSMRSLMSTVSTYCALTRFRMVFSLRSLSLMNVLFEKLLPKNRPMTIETAIISGIHTKDDRLLFILYIPNLLVRVFCNMHAFNSGLLKQLDSVGYSVKFAEHNAPYSRLNDEF